MLHWLQDHKKAGDGEGKECVFQIVARSSISYCIVFHKLCYTNQSIHQTFQDYFVENILVGFVNNVNYVTLFKIQIHSNIIKILEISLFCLSL